MMPSQKSQASLTLVVRPARLALKLEVIELRVWVNRLLLKVSTDMVGWVKATAKVKVSASPEAA